MVLRPLNAQSYSDLNQLQYRRRCRSFGTLGPGRPDDGASDGEGMRRGRNCSSRSLALSFDTIVRVGQDDLWIQSERETVEDSMSCVQMRNLYRLDSRTAWYGAAVESGSRSRVVAVRNVCSNCPYV